MWKIIFYDIIKPNLFLYLNMLSPSFTHSPWRAELLSKVWRTLSWKWNSKENYQNQLWLDLDEIVRIWKEIFEQNWELSILDVWWNTSTTILELKELLVQAWIPTSKIRLNKVDLFKVEQKWISFLNWDLEDEDFLVYLTETLWIWTQWIIFMNQVSQYLGDKLKIIKFICELLLKKWWKFYFNLVSRSFNTWNLPFSIFENALNSIMLDESSGFKINCLWSSSYSPDLRLYQVQKNEDNAEIEFPDFSRTIDSRETDWFKSSLYNFRKRLSLKWLKTKIETKRQVSESLK